MRLRMDILVPTGGSPFPAVIYIGGGGFVFAPKEAALPRRAYIAEAGFVVASIQYRTVRHGATFRDGVEDVKSAVRFLRAHTAAYDIDPRRLAVWGESAGGYLAAMAALTSGNRDFESGDDLDQDSDVQAVVDMFGASDVSRIGDDFDAETRARLMAGDNLLRYIGSKNGSLDTSVASTVANPLTYVTPSAPPFLVLHGSQDRLISPSQTLLLHESLQRGRRPKHAVRAGRCKSRRPLILGRQEVRARLVKQGDHGPHRRLPVDDHRSETPRGLLDASSRVGVHRAGIGQRAALGAAGTAAVVIAARIRQRAALPEAFDTAGVHPADCRDLADLANFPFTAKEDLREQYPFGMFAVPREQIARLHASSGTTGKPTVVGYTREDIRTWAKLVARSIRASGGRPGDRVHVAYGYGLFTGGLGAHYGAEELGCTVIPVSGGMTERQVNLIRDFEPDIIMVTPSYMLAIVDEMVHQGLDPRATSLRVGIFGAEPWTDEMRRELEERLDIDAVDIYGLSEVIGPGVANECVETKDGPHVWEDHFYPEVIDPDTGDVLPDGETGRARIHLSDQASNADRSVPHP